MSWIKSERLEFIDSYERKYGIRLKENDEMLPVLQFMFDAATVTQARLTEAEKLLTRVEKIVNEATTKMNPKMYDIKQGDAFKWQVGIGVKIMMIGLSALAIVWSMYFFLGYYRMHKKAQIIVESYPFMDRAVIKTNKNGNHFIEFLKPRDRESTMFYTEYDLQSDETIRVYIGQQTSKP